MVMSYLQTSFHLATNEAHVYAMQCISQPLHFETDSIDQFVSKHRYSHFVRIQKVLFISISSIVMLLRANNFFDHSVISIEGILNTMSFLSQGGFDRGDFERLPIFHHIFRSERKLSLWQHPY